MPGTSTTDLPPEERNHGIYRCLLTGSITGKVAPFELYFTTSFTLSIISSLIALSPRLEKNFPEPNLTS